MSSETNYNSWTKTSLIERLRELEAELKTRPEAPLAAVKGENAHAGEAVAAGRGARKAKAKRKMDPSRHSSRFIALKLAYLGKNYGGFEFQATGNQPSIEEELWKALTKACLIFPEDEKVVHFECCEYSKCGRTDRGVSAFGQVIGLRVRSNMPLPRTENAAMAAPEDAEPPFDDLRDELCYPRMLNRLLPNDIRILAWCPSPPMDFSARFSCRERQYRYFFTQPAFLPLPVELDGGEKDKRGGLESGWLDIEAMRDAAKRFEGDQDFRNFCKIDPGKQITNFRRHIFEADVVQVPAGEEDADSALACVPRKTYYFHVRGSAFLWHQIRHMVAVLFLVGQRLEPPSIVTELLDSSKNPSRPGYNMADEVPLVLWDCIFPDLSQENEASDQTRRHDALDWIYVGDEHASSKFGQFGVVQSVWQLWRGHKMDELLASQLLRLISRQGSDNARRPPDDTERKDAGSIRVFEGGNTSRLGGRYVRIMDRERLQTPEEQNERYAQRKGYTSAADMRAAWTAAAAAAAAAKPIE